MAGLFVARLYHMLGNCLHLPSYVISQCMTYCYEAFGALTTSDQPRSLPANGTNGAPYLLIGSSTSATLTLPDGRQFGYAQYGSLTGRPIFYIHGLPGSRVEAAQFDELATRLGGRIIAVDRPGIGWSSPHPARTVLDHTKDVERLAEHLKLDEYGVLGISGGGPYALACAASLPADKLKAVTIVCGLGPADIGTSEMDWWHWLGFAFGFRYFPGVVRWYFSRTPAARLDLSDETRLELIRKEFSNSIAHEKDVAFFTDEDILRLFLQTSREHFARGCDAFAQDGRLLCMDLGFRIEDIRPDLPVRLWYGKLDVHVPPRHGEQIALRISGKAHLRVEDETHASLTANCKEMFFEDLINII